MSASLLTGVSAWLRAGRTVAARIPNMIVRCLYAEAPGRRYEVQGYRYPVSKYVIGAQSDVGGKKGVYTINDAQTLTTLRNYAFTIHNLLYSWCRCCTNRLVHFPPIFLTIHFRPRRRLTKVTEDSSKDSSRRSSKQ
eukprot:299784-Prorocentrum_minimum.AAC.3